jgi:hypothetical protein
MTRACLPKTVFAIWLVALLATRTASSPAEEEAADAASALSPQEVLDDCLEAIEEGDFARYVDHLSEREQQQQAGYALFATSMMLQAMVAEGEGEQIEPETLLFSRAMSDLIEEHRAAKPASVGVLPSTMPPPIAPSTYAVYTPTAVMASAYPSAGVVWPPQAGELLRQSAAGLADPRAFLIAVLAEFARPVEVAGAQPPDGAPQPAFAEKVRALRQEKCTIYTRGDYAVAVPQRAETADSQGLPPGPAEFQAPPPPSPWPLRIEFRRENGQWKITHLLPLAELGPMVGTTAYASPQPVCFPAPAAYPPVYAAPPVATAPPAYAPALPYQPAPPVYPPPASPPSTASIPE